MRRLSLAALAVTAALPALAQDSAGDEWMLVRDEHRQLTTAFVAFTPAPALMVRCNHRAYEAVIMGLPEAPAGRTRPLKVAFGDEAFEDQTWNVGTDRTLVVGDFPAPFARKLRLGGRLQIVVPNGAGEGRNLRYDVTLPPSPAAIDTTLTACGRPLVDPRDADLQDIPEGGLAPPVTWVRPPRGEYPPRAKYASGWAVLTCMAHTDGTLGDCVIESEFPYDGGYGEQALKAARHARVAYDGLRGPTVMISYRTRFLLG